MSHLVIVGGSSGIGRDIQPFISGRVSTLMRWQRDPDDATALLFCQRARAAADDWDEEIDASLTRTKEIIQHAVGVKSIVIMASVAAVSVEEEQPIS